jgi:hypothetical protein
MGGAGGMWMMGGMVLVWILTVVILSARNCSTHQIPAELSRCPHLCETLLLCTLSWTDVASGKLAV